MNYYARDDVTSFLEHHGIKGQKWGVRRFQNKDGTLTPAGKIRYSKVEYGGFSRKNKKRRVSDLSNDELRELTERLTREAEYYRALNQRDEYKNPRVANKASKGSKDNKIINFAEKLAGNLITTYATTKAKHYLDAKYPTSNKSKDTSKDTSKDPYTDRFTNTNSRTSHYTSGNNTDSSNSLATVDDDYDDYQLYYGPPSRKDKRRLG